ncbi:hypothetical protein DFH09DRAFT_1079487 [Mycena vulgaris]|nr:hypothetical protein DFH09DRAFT_1079487 [Mycena vulgaris]
MTLHVHLLMLNHLLQSMPMEVVLVPEGIVTVRPGRWTAPKPAVQWTVRRRYGGAESLATPDGTGRWTGRPSTVDGRLSEIFVGGGDMLYRDQSVDSQIILLTVAVHRVMRLWRGRSGLDIRSRLRANYWRVRAADATGMEFKIFCIPMSKKLNDMLPLWCTSAALQVAVRGQGGAAGADGHATVALAALYVHAGPWGPMWHFYVVHDK